LTTNLQATIEILVSEEWTPDEALAVANC